MKYVVFFLILLLSGCTSPSGVSSSDSGDDSSGGASNEMKTTRGGHHGQSVARANNTFAFDLYKKLRNSGENLFFSPYSISSALAMTYSGASGVTREQMSGVLGFPDDNLVHVRGYQGLQDHLDTLSGDDLKLHMANALWCQQDYDFREDFLDISRRHFATAIRQVNFKQHYQQVRKQINQWVENQTEEKIRDLIDPGVLNPMTRMVLVNAIYFNGKWEYPFSEKKTREDFFHPTPQKKEKAPFMNQSVRLPYAENKLFKAVEIPYAKGSMSMLILLPGRHEDLSKLESRINGDFYEALTDSLDKEEVDLSIPRFTLKAKYQLNAPLQQMGMSSAFGGNADFSGMTGNKDLYISDIVHQSYVQVHEKGTEAAAATGVVMQKTAIVERKSFIADHPFIFMIRDQQTQAILFMGKLSHPG